MSELTKLMRGRDYTFERPISLCLGLHSRPDFREVDPLLQGAVVTSSLSKSKSKHENQALDGANAYRHDNIRRL